MKEPVAWAGIWLVIGFGVGYLVTTIRHAMHATSTARSLAYLLKTMVVVGDWTKVSKLARDLEDAGTLETDKAERS